MRCLGYGIWFEIQERILISLSATISSFFLASRVKEKYKLISTTREYTGTPGTQRQFSENICSEDDLRPRIFGTFVVKFLACLPLLGFPNT